MVHASTQTITSYSFVNHKHFPELVKNSSLKEHEELPVPKKETEMIVNPIIVPDMRETLTLMTRQNGKLVQKLVYMDGTPVIEQSLVTIKKPVYNSWASVLNPESMEVSQYNVEHDYEE
jgi:hypothetical protein